MSTPAMRLAAVRLAVLHSADRRWLLEQLPRAQATVLQRLLASPTLRQMRLTADDTLKLAEQQQKPTPPQDELGPMLPQQVDALGPSWKMLWMAVHRPAGNGPGDAERQLAVARDTMPGALARAIASWPNEQAGGTSP